MPQIEGYSGRNLERIPVRKRTSIDLQGFAEGLGAAAQVMAEYTNSMRITDRQNKQVAIDQAVIDERARVSELKGGNAVGETERFEEKREAYAESLMGDEENEVTRKELKLHINQRLQQHQSWLQEYEMREGDEYRKQTDIAARITGEKELIDTPVGDLASIDAKVAEVTLKYVEREGKKRVTPELEAIYKQGVTDQYLFDKAKQWFKEDPLAMYTWFSKNKKEMEKRLSTKAYTALVGMAESYKDTAEEEDFFRQAITAHPGDFMGAYLSLSANPNPNAQAAGTRLYQNWQREKNIEAYKKAEAIDAVGEMVVDASAIIAKMKNPEERMNEFEKLIQALRENTTIPLAMQTQMIANLTKANLQAIPAQVTRLLVDIEDGRVNSVGEIALRYGDGIGASMTPYTNALNKRKSLQAQGNRNWYKRAEDQFRSLLQMYPKSERVKAFEAGGNPEVLTEHDLEIFRDQLDAFMLKNQLSKWSPEVNNEASRLLAIVRKKAENWAVDYVPLIGGLFGDEASNKITFKSEGGGEGEAAAPAAAKKPAPLTAQQILRQAWNDPSMLNADTLEGKLNAFEDFWNQENDIPFSQAQKDLLRKKWGANVQ